MQVFGRILGRTGSDRLTAHQMGEIWAEAPGCGRAANRMAVYAGGGFKHAPAGGFFRILIRELVLCTDPSVEIFGTVYRDAQKHLGVLRSAILSALAEIHPGLARIYPRIVDTIGYQVSLARELGNPKTVIGVGGEQFQKCRSGMSRAANRNVQFVSRYDAEGRIT